ncbi:MAG: hypothetical protein ABJH05_09885 [Fulvivirga sp.]
MFIGHFAVGLAAKKSSHSISLALAFIAVQFLDLLWPIFALIGIESFEIAEGITKITPLDFTHYPYSHSLLMTVVWSVLFGGTYYAFKKNSRNALIYGGLVFSHWILDFLTHRPDLPLTPFGETKLGLGLWNYPAIEIALEVGFFLIAVLLYIKSTEVKRKVAFWSLITFFLVIHVMNLLGPPPPSTSAVAWSANLMWLMVVWAWYIEKDKTGA